MAISTFIDGYHLTPPLSLVDLHHFERIKGEMHFNEHNPFTQDSKVAQVRARAFFQHLEGNLSTRDRSKSPLHALLERTIQLSNTEANQPLFAEITQAFFKQRGYLSRLFSDESWEEWTENRTALGKIASLFKDCIESHTEVSKFIERLGEPRPEGRGMIWKGLRTPPKCNFELPGPKGPGFPFLDESAIHQASEEADVLLRSLMHRNAMKTTPFLPMKCLTGFFGGTIVSLLTKNPLPLFVGLNECLPQTYAQQKIGNEFQVNTYTFSSQRKPSVASLDDGNFVVTWTSYGQDGSINGVYGQLFDGNGTKIGSEFRANTYVTDYQADPSVASFTNGNFVVTWTSHGQDGSGSGVYGQLFNGNGTKIGSEFRANTYVTDYQAEPSVASFTNGNFAVTWDSFEQDGSDWGVYGQLFDGNGSKIGSEFRANSYTTNSQESPSVASFSNGNFVVTWDSLDQDGSDREVYGQLFDGNGSKIGSEFRANSYTTDNQWFPSVAGLSNGNFVVTWQSHRQDGSDYGIFGQLFDGNGSKIGSEFRANTYTNSHQLASSVASFSNGNFVVTWHSNLQDGSNYGVYGQLFDGNGSMIGSEFRASSYTTSNQLYPSVASFSNGNFVVTWQSYDQDGSENGIYGQIFNDQLISSTSSSSSMQLSSSSLTSSSMQLSSSSLTSSSSSNIGGIIAGVIGIVAVCIVGGIGYGIYRIYRRRDRSDDSCSLSVSLEDQASRSSSAPDRAKVLFMASESSSSVTSTSGFPRESAPLSSSASSSQSSSLSREQLASLLPTAVSQKNLTRLLQSLEALSITPEQIVMSLTFIKDWEQELHSVAEKAQASRNKIAAQKELFDHRNSSVGDYYEVLWTRISDTILACKTMHSEMVEKDFKNPFGTKRAFISKFSKVVEKVGGFLGPGANIGSFVLCKIFNFISDPEKERAVQNLSRLVREVRDIDILAEEVARRLTKMKMIQLEKMTDGSKTSSIDRFKIWWQTFRANEFTTEAKKLAIEDALLIIKAVALDTTGHFNEPDLVEKLINCVLPGSQQTPGALGGSKTVTVSSSTTFNPEALRQMFESLQRMETQMTMLQQELASKEDTLSPEEQRLMSERLKRLESQVEMLKQKLASKEDTSDEVSEGAQLLAQSSSHSKEKRAPERIVTMERNIAELCAGLSALREDLVQIATELGVQLPSDRASKETPEKEELLQRENDEESLR